MKILDRYVLKSFIASYCVCGFALLGLYVLVDSFAVTSKLIRRATSAGDLAVTVPAYAFYKLPVFYYQISPYITLMAAMFTVVRIIRQNELVPVKAAGISVFRVLVPLFCMALLAGAATAVTQEYVIPALRSRIEALDENVDERFPDELFNVWKKDSGGSTFFIKYYRISEHYMHRVDITQFYEDTTQALLMIHAEKGYWKRGEDGVERWYLSGGTYNRYGRDGMSLVGGPQPIGDEGLVIVSNAEDIRDDGRIYFVSDITYKDIEESEPDDYTLLATSALHGLGARYRSLKPPGLLVSIHKRFSWPLASVLLLALGLPFALKWRTGTKFVGIGICIIVCAAFFVVDMVCEQLGSVGSLNAYAAAWLPTVLFAAVGLIAMESVRS